MKKEIIITFFLSILMLFPLTIASTEEIEQSVISTNRPFYLITSGITRPGDIIPGKGWFFILQMLQPWPDQTYFSLFGFINYENGTTTIINSNTGETIEQEGEHRLIFYNFYGPVCSVDDYNVSFEGNAVYAKILGV